MGRRFGIGADVAFTGVLVALLMNLWIQRGTELSATRMAVALAAPSAAGVGIMVLALSVPPLIGPGRLARPGTFCLPAIHAALTVLVARTVLTGPSATMAVPEPLHPAQVWLQPLNVLVLFLFSWLALEVTHLRNRNSPVS